jgi:hypothetical protein
MAWLPGGDHQAGDQQVIRAASSRTTKTAPLEPRGGSRNADIDHCGQVCPGQVDLAQAVLLGLRDTALINRKPRCQGWTQPKNAHVTADRAVVHHAVGMISVQLAVSIATALQRLQAYAADHRQTVADVAADVVARRLHSSTNDAD